jgi:hypothetical protein
MVTIMIGGSYDSNHRRTRELDTSYFHNPTVRDELLPLHHGAKGDGVDGVEGATGSGSSSVSPPILAVCRSVLCISCFSAAPLHDRMGGSLL